MADRSAPGPTAAPPRGRLARAWAAPVWAHLAALALVLVALMAVVGTSASFSADEGAVILQARSLARGHGWFVPHPAAAADPSGVNFPLEFSLKGDGGWAPFAKHPLYALVLAGADRLGGVAAMVLLSLAGTLAAAAVAAALARRLDPALGRPAVWAVGLASPLLVDGFLLIAHTLGAALAGAAVLAAVVAIERRSPHIALAVVPALAGCVLVRSEGAFLAAALAVVAVVVALRSRPARPAAAAVAVGSLVAGAGARLAEGWWTAHLAGGAGLAASAAAPASSDGGGLLAGRVQGFVLTWLTPTYGGRPLAGLALYLMLLALVLGALTTRFHPENGARIVGCAAAAAGAAAAAFVVQPATAVPGLLLAFPLATVGLLVLRRETLRSATAQVAAGTSALFALAVIATQYAKGGGGEWGGRYFALAIPVIVPVLLLALREQRDRLAPGTARRAAAALALCSLALATTGVYVVRASHRGIGRMVATVDAAGRTVAAADPVLVTTEAAVPRFAWSTFDRQRWLLAGPDDLADLVGRLRQTGVARIGFVTTHAGRDRPLLDRAGARVADGTAPEQVGPWEILVLQIA